MIRWLKNGSKSNPASLSVLFGDESVLVQKDRSSFTQSKGAVAISLDVGAGALLEQLEDDGFASQESGSWVISWPSLYAAIEKPDYADALGILSIPSTQIVVPSLESSNSLTDKDFEIRIAGWRGPESQKLTNVSLTGGIIQYDGGRALLPNKTWDLTRRVIAFARRSNELRTGEYQRQT